MKSVVKFNKVICLMLISEEVYQKAICNEFQLQINNSSGCTIPRKNKTGAQEIHKVPKMHCNSKHTEKIVLGKTACTHQEDG